MDLVDHIEGSGLIDGVIGWEDEIDAEVAIITLIEVHYVERGKGLPAHLSARHWVGGCVTSFEGYLECPPELRVCDHRNGWSVVGQRAWLPRSLVEELGLDPTEACACRIHRSEKVGRPQWGIADFKTACSILLLRRWYSKCCCRSREAAEE